MDKEPKTMVKKALVVAENEKDCTKKSLKSETTKSNMNKTMKLKNHQRRCGRQRYKTITKTRTSKEK